MSSPIFQQPANPSAEVLEVEAELLKRDGMFYSGDLYFANPDDAARWRRIEAEKIVRERERQARIVCAWCHERIKGQVVVVVAMRGVHPACAKEFDEWVQSKPDENNSRWASVTDDTPVEFDGEMTIWAELSGNERTMCSFTDDGRLVGSYPF